MAAALLACALAGDAAAQGVVKCIDADGNVTYQDSPCASGRPGRTVELPKAETLEDTRAWETAAKDARVVRGMPKRWVLKSRGAPLEIRPGAPREDATEVWRYSSKEGVLLVGFTGPNVGWVREEAVPRASATAPAPVAANAPAATRGAQNRRFVLEGRYCEHVFAEIGAADREAPVAGGGVRYTYDPREGDPSMRTVFTCVNGKVADVERTMVK
ncbi:MAG: DUF4124 domain-containing protein [Burkholderiales bacterium]